MTYMRWCIMVVFSITGWGVWVPWDRVSGKGRRNQFCIFSSGNWGIRRSRLLFFYLILTISPPFLLFSKKPKVETEEAGAQTVGRISPPVAVRESSRAAIAPPCTETCQICDFVVLVFLCTPPSNSPTDSHFPPTSDFPGEQSGTTKTTQWCWYCNCTTMVPCTMHQNLFSFGWTLTPPFPPNTTF